MDEEKKPQVEKDERDLHDFLDDPMENKKRTKRLVGPHSEEEVEEPETEEEQEEEVEEEVKPEPKKHRVTDVPDNYEINLEGKEELLPGTYILSEEFEDTETLNIKLVGETFKDLKTIQVKKAAYSRVRGKLNGAGFVSDTMSGQVETSDGKYFVREIRFRSTIF